MHFKLQVLRVLWLGSAFVGACYAPHPSAGSPCIDTQSCPAPLICTTAHLCEPTETTKPPDSGDPFDAEVVSVIDAPVPKDGGPSACADFDLGSSLGSNVVTGNTQHRADTYKRCGGGGSPDVAYAWTAPAAGTYVIDTCGGSDGFDSVLSVLDGGCSGAELACNDDTCDVRARVSVTLAEGQLIIIVVDGSDDAGPYALSIRRN